VSEQPYWEDERRSLAIYHADIFEFTEPITADIIVTDPPYSRAGALHSGRRAARLMSDESRESDQFWLRWFTDAARVFLPHVSPAGCGFIFCDYRTINAVERAISGADSGWHVSQCLVWDRESTGMGSPFRASHELIAFIRGPRYRHEGKKNIRNVLRHSWFYGAHKHHPAEKPAELIAELIRSVGPSDSITFDPFMGSGSTLVAAQSIGRRAFGVEIEERYCERAVKRLQQSVMEWEVPA
jgi:site-specific DNA-methyltransferase (adenine-specific)